MNVGLIQKLENALYANACGKMGDAELRTIFAAHSLNIFKARHNKVWAYLGRNTKDVWVFEC